VWKAKKGDIVSPEHPEVFVVAEPTWKTMEDGAGRI
jgi:hypothetical protein